MIVTQDYRVDGWIGFCTKISGCAFTLLFSKSLSEGFSEVMMPHMIFDRISCAFKGLCSPKEVQSPLEQN